MLDLDMPGNWKDAVVRAADYDINAYKRAVKDLTENNSGHYAEECIIANYREIALAHDKMTLFMIRLFEKMESRKLPKLVT